jgi:tetratricopeptide (TPR) repeat protein
VCALRWLAFAYDQAGEPDSALDVYERYVTTPWFAQPSTYSLWLALAYNRLGVLYEQQGDTAKAIYYYGKIRGTLAGRRSRATALGGGRTPGTGAPSTLPRFWSVQALLRHPRLDPLRDHPRFQALLEEYE